MGTRVDLLPQAVHARGPAPAIKTPPPADAAELFTSKIDSTLTRPSYIGEMAPTVETATACDKDGKDGGTFEAEIPLEVASKAASKGATQRKPP